MQRRNPILSIILATLLSFVGRDLLAQAPIPTPISIGFVGSLSSFAANYGQAVLDGARLAAEELTLEGQPIELKTEDDQSIAKNTVNSYIKLAKIDKVQAIIGGSWWANNIVKLAERDSLPLMSCETVYNGDTILANTYFMLSGDLRSWVRAYEPLIAAKSWKRGAAVRYASGFGTTLATEMQALFSNDPRKYLGSIDYSDIDMSDAASIVVKLRKLDPEVIYVDAQPAGLSNLLRKLSEAGLSKITVLTNMVAEDMLVNKLFTPTSSSNELFFTKRATSDANFAQRFRTRYGYEPRLNADLGYYSVRLLSQALKTSDPVATLKQAQSINGKRFTFDEHNVYTGTPQEIFQVSGSDWKPWHPTN